MYSLKWIGEPQTMAHSGLWIGQVNLDTSKETAVLTSINPSTASPLGQVYLADQAGVEATLAATTDCAKTWRMVPAPKRAELIRRLCALIRQEADNLARLITLEMGKPLAEARGEIQEILDMGDFALGQSRMLYGKTIASERPQHRLFEQWHPLGVVSILTAFNFPMAVWAWNAFLAVVCGNTVIWKPSHQTPLCAIALQTLCAKVLSEGDYGPIFSLVISDHQIATALIDDPRVNLVSFTGSTEIGRLINQRVARRFGRSLLELGGNNGLIVDETANLDLALRAILFSAIGTAGQRCTSLRRLFVHRQVAPILQKALVKAYQDVRIGDPLQSGIHMGPLANAMAFQQYKTMIEDLSRAGIACLAGGTTLPQSGYYVTPTLVEVGPDSPFILEEHFLPILFWITYDDWEDVMVWHNQVRQGLSSACFTQRLDRAEYFLSAQGSDCGLVNINIGTSGAEIGGAFGGEKETGGGREAGSDAWQAYMRRQTSTLNWGTALPLAQGINFKVT